MKNHLKLHGSLLALWSTYWTFRKVESGLMGPETEESLKVKEAILNLTRAFHDSKEQTKNLERQLTERKTFMDMVRR